VATNDCRRSGVTIGSSIAISQRSGQAVQENQAAATQENGAVADAVDRLEIVGGEKDDASRGAKFGEACTKRRGGAVVQTGERFVQQDEPRLVQECALDDDSGLLGIPRENRPAGSSRASRPARSSAALTVRSTSPGA
jgi:hypothetical protein